MLPLTVMSGHQVLPLLWLPKVTQQSRARTFGGVQMLHKHHFLCYRSHLAIAALGRGPTRNESLGTEMVPPKATRSPGASEGSWAAELPEQHRRVESGREDPSLGDPVYSHHLLDAFFKPEPGM
jgi:hypothetical protein